MGAWKDLLDFLKTKVSGPVTFGGTAFPTSEGFPTIAAQVIRGGFYALETLEQLVDIPYQNLQVNMEVVVGEHVRPDTSTHEKTKYYLIQMPPENTKLSELGGYTLSDYWGIVLEGSEEEPVAGPPGDNGWSPVFATESDGANREVLKLILWTGGTGVQPAIPSPAYIGTSGFVSKGLAANIKGNQGPAGSAAAVRPEYYVSIGTKTVAAPNDLHQDPMNQFNTASDVLIVTNSWTSARKFKVYAEFPYANINGPVNVVSVLKKKSSPFNFATVLDGTTMDETYGREDYVNSPSPGSAFKLYSNGLLNLAAGESAYIRIIVKKTGGGNFNYEKAFIEAFGL